MVRNQNEKDHIVFNLDDAILNKELRNLKPQTHGFSIEKRIKPCLM